MNIENIERPKSNTEECIEKLKKAEGVVRLVPKTSKVDIEYITKNLNLPEDDKKTIVAVDFYLDGSESVEGSKKNNGRKTFW